MTDAPNAPDAKPPAEGAERLEQSYVHCEMCGYLWRWEDWSPEVACPRCGDGSDRRRHSKA